MVQFALLYLPLITSEDGQFLHVLIYYLCLFFCKLLKKGTS